MKEQIQKDLKEKFLQGGFSEGVGYDEAQNIPADTNVMPDEELKEKIIAALNDDTHIIQDSIVVDVNYGEVRLSGTVANRDMLNAAKECVQKVSGVKKIVDDLQIKVE